MARWIPILLLLLLPALASAGDLRIAVSPFDNAADTDDLDALGKGLQAMLTTDLAQVEALTLVEREKLQEVLAELELQASDVVDPATAAEAGQLLGATHVIAGTFTVVDDTMRLDARLTAVGSGAIEATAQAQGERAAFFELEKALVRDLLEALDVHPSPQERAGIARIHTADFESFQEFSAGVALYDAERYAEAVETLERVAARDERFELAERTLEEYEQLLAAVKAKRRALELTQAEQRFVARQQAAQGEAAIVERLYAIADDPERPWNDRVAALYLLADGLYTHGSGHQFRELEYAEDRFALDRAAEVAYARLWAEVRPKWPELTPFLVVSHGSWFDGPETFEEKFAYLRRGLFRAPDPSRNRRGYGLYECRGQGTLLDEGGDMLHLDARERVAELERAFEEGRECLGERTYRDGRYDVAEAWAGLLELDRSTSILEEMARSTDDPRWARTLESAIADNQELAEILARSDAPLFREMVLLEEHGSGFGTYLHRDWMADALAGSDRARWRLAKLRVAGEHPYRRPLWVSDELAWVLPRGPGLATGRRTDPLRTDALRYYDHGLPTEETWGVIGGGTRTVTREPEPAEPAFVLLGAGPRDDFTLSATLDHARADDWWSPSLPPPRDEAGDPVEFSEGRPLVGVLFGIRDVDVDPVCDPDGTGMTSIPMKGWAVILEGDTLRLGRVREVDPDWSEKRCTRFTDPVDDWSFDPVAQASVPDRERRALSVAVEGGRVTAKVGRATRRFDLPERVPPGFVGLVMHGHGYVEVSDLDLE